MTLEAALAGKEIPPDIRDELALLDLEYWGFDERIHGGQIVVHRGLAAEVREIFQEILAARFPIESILPVVAFNWCDDASMAANNSSGFNFRYAVGKAKLSQHAYGRAIDINPVQNPYIKGELVLPPGSVHNPTAPGTLLVHSTPVVAFERRGWTWGGRWTTLSDWHHFEKPA